MCSRHNGTLWVGASTRATCRVTSLFTDDRFECFTRLLLFVAAMSRMALAVAALLASWLAPACCARLVVVPLSSESHIAAFTALTGPLETLGGHEVHMVVCQELAAEAARSATEHGAAGHTLHTYPLRPDLFADDLAAISTAHPILAMRLGYKVLAALIERVAGNATLLATLSALQPDLIIGDAAAAYGHWLSELMRVPAIEFDVGTSGALLHSMWGGQARADAAGCSRRSSCAGRRRRCCHPSPRLRALPQSGLLLPHCSPSSTLTPVGFRVQSWTLKPSPRASAPWQAHPAYLPAPGTLLPSTGLTLLQRASNTASMLATKALAHLNWNHGPIAA